MEIVLIVGLFCALIFLTHVSDKNNEKPALPAPPPIPPPSPKRFVSVVFNEGDKKTYDYFFDDNLNLMLNDYVEVSARGELKIAIVKYVSAPGERSPYARATVIRRVPAPPPKIYIEPQTTRTVSTSAQTYNPQPKQQISPSPKRFVQVIFKKGSHKRYDYLLGNMSGLKVDDFVLVPIRKSKERLDKEMQRMLIEIELTGKIGEKPRKTICLPAKIKYISKHGEFSEHARSEIIKKLDRKAW